METQQNTPTRKPKFSLGFFFLSLGSLIALITTVVSFLNLVFATLDQQFPDVLGATYQYGYDSFNYDGMRMALATLIIFFPIFLIVTHYWKKTQLRGLGTTDEVIRTWVVYIVLFLSALVVAVDLVTLVRYFVSGEITTRFILKVIAAFVIAAMAGAYYIAQLTHREKIFGIPIYLSSAIKSCLLFIALIIWSFHVMGTPGQQREWRLDQQRVDDLQSIQSQVTNYWQEKETLPATLNDLVNPLSGYSLPVDPEFQKGLSYEYNVKDNPPAGSKESPTFELCATFDAAIPQGWQENSGGPIVYPVAANPAGTVSSMPATAPGSGGVNESWDHGPGHTCFERTIDPDMYPPYPKPVATPIPM